MATVRGRGGAAGAGASAVEGTIESGALGPWGCVAARAGTEPAPASGAPDWSVRIVTVRIFFGPNAAGVAGTAVVPDGAAVKGETCVVPGAGFGAVAVVIAGAAGFGGSAAIVGLFDVGLAE